MSRALHVQRPRHPGHAGRARGGNSPPLGGREKTMHDEGRRPTDLPEELDPDRLAEAALAILSLTLHEGRVWKSMDWNLMNLLHEKGWISDPVSKAKSVVLTDEGERRARRFLLEHFGRQTPD